MNYFNLYPGDYLKDTTRLSLVDHGAYLRLMLTYYGEEQPLPADYAEVYNIVGAISAADKAAVRKVADRYFPIAADGLRHNERADDEISKGRLRIETSRKNGSRNRHAKDPSAHPVGDPSGDPVGVIRNTQQVTCWPTQQQTRPGVGVRARARAPQSREEAPYVAEGDL